MSVPVADTHAVVWYLTEADHLSGTAEAALDQASETGRTLHVSAISLVELTYLVEKRWGPLIGLERLWEALADPASVFQVAPVDEAVAQAVARVPREDVPDMPDRIIAAAALHLGLPLVTRDRRIRSAGIQKHAVRSFPGSRKDAER